MTDQTPATEAGRRLWIDMTGGDTDGPFGASARHMGNTIAAIEAEARADAHAEYLAEEAKRIETARKKARADALREAAERVRAIMPGWMEEMGGSVLSRAAVLAILDPEAS